MNITTFLKTDFSKLNFQNKDATDLFYNLLSIENLNSSFNSKENLSNIMKIVHIFANDPLIAQEEILKKLSISKEKLIDLVNKNAVQAKENTYEKLKIDHSEAWQQIWDKADIQIEGDINAQQAIRFNIFQCCSSFFVWNSTSDDVTTRFF